MFDCVQMCAYKVLIGALSHIQATCIFLGGISYNVKLQAGGFSLCGCASTTGSFNQLELVIFRTFKMDVSISAQ